MADCLLPRDSNRRVRSDLMASPRRGIKRCSSNVMRPMRASRDQLGMFASDVGECPKR